MDQNMQAVLLFHNQQATAPNTTNSSRAATAAVASGVLNAAVPVREEPPPAPPAPAPAPAPEKEHHGKRQRRS